jgi:Mn2+/Fe2+ NRAMP family transporter
MLGPGLITGAADDDPSGIATCSQAGAQFGFRLGWTLLLTFPLMLVIQALSARIAATDITRDRPQNRARCQLKSTR